MATFIKNKTGAFKKLGDADDLPSKQRSEARMKAYSSATDARAWVANLSDNKQYILDLMAAETPARGQSIEIEKSASKKYVPVDVIVKTVMSSKDSDIRRLSQIIKDLESFISELDLSATEKLKYKSMKSLWAAGDSPIMTSPQKVTPDLSQAGPSARFAPETITSRIVYDEPSSSRFASDTHLSKPPSDQIEMRTSSESRVPSPRKGMHSEDSVIMRRSSSLRRHSRSNATSPFTRSVQTTKPESIASSKSKIPVQTKNVDLDKQHSSVPFKPEESNIGPKLSPRLTPSPIKNDRKSDTSSEPISTERRIPSFRKGICHCPEESLSGSIRSSSMGTPGSISVESTHEKRSGPVPSSDLAPRSTTRESAQEQKAEPSSRSEVASRSIARGPTQQYSSESTPTFTENRVISPKKGACLCPEESISNESQISRSMGTTQSGSIESTHPQNSEPGPLSPVEPKSSTRDSQHIVEARPRLEESPIRIARESTQQYSAELIPMPKESSPHPRSETVGNSLGKMESDHRSPPETTKSVSARLSNIPEKIVSRKSIPQSTQGTAMPDSGQMSRTSSSKSPHSMPESGPQVSYISKETEESPKNSRSSSEKERVSTPTKRVPSPERIDKEAIDHLESLRQTVEERDYLQSVLNHQNEEIAQIADDIRSCDDEAERMAMELERVKHSQTLDGLQFMTYELELLKKYCLMIHDLRTQNGDLRAQLEATKVLPKPVEQLESSHSTLLDILSDQVSSEDLREMLNEKLAKLEELQKERDELVRKVNSLEEQLDNRNNESEMSKSEKQIKDSLNMQIADLQERLMITQLKADKADELQRALENAQNRLLQEPERASKGVLAVEQSSPLRQLSISIDLEVLKAKARDADVLKVENEKMQMRINELAFVDKKYKILRDKYRSMEAKNASQLSEILQNGGRSAKQSVSGIQQERDTLLRKIANLECVMADQEDEINRLVMHIDRLTQAQEKQAEKSKQIVNELRSMIESKDAIIDSSADHLAEVQTQLKDTIAALTRETQSLKQQLSATGKTVECFQNRIQTLSEDYSDAQVALDKEKRCSRLLKQEILDLIGAIEELQSCAQQYFRMSQAEQVSSLMEKVLKTKASITSEPEGIDAPEDLTEDQTGSLPSSKDSIQSVLEEISKDSGREKDEKVKTIVTEVEEDVRESEEIFEESAKLEEEVTASTQYEETKAVSQFVVSDTQTVSRDSIRSSGKHSSVKVTASTQYEETIDLASVVASDKIMIEVSSESAGEKKLDGQLDEEQEEEKELFVVDSQIKAEDKSEASESTVHTPITQTEKENEAEGEEAGKQLFSVGSQMRPGGKSESVDTSLNKISETDKEKEEEMGGEEEHRFSVGSQTRAEDKPETEVTDIPTSVIAITQTDQERIVENEGTVLVGMSSPKSADKAETLNSTIPSSIMTITQTDKEKEGDEEEDGKRLFGKDHEKILEEKSVKPEEEEDEGEEIDKQISVGQSRPVVQSEVLQSDIPSSDTTISKLGKEDDKENELIGVDSKTRPEDTSGAPESAVPSTHFTAITETDTDVENKQTICLDEELRSESDKEGKHFICVDSPSRQKFLTDLEARGELTALRGITCMCKGQMFGECVCKRPKQVDQIPSTTTSGVSSFIDHASETTVRRSLMERLSEKIGEISQQRDSLILENQALRKHTSEIKDIAKARISQLSLDLQKIESEILDKESKITLELRDENQSLLDEIDALKKELSEAKKEIVRLKSEIDRLRQPRQIGSQVFANIEEEPEEEQPKAGDTEVGIYVPTSDHKEPREKSFPSSPILAEESSMGSVEKEIIPASISIIDEQGTPMKVGEPEEQIEEKTDEWQPSKEFGKYPSSVKESAVILKESILPSIQAIEQIPRTAPSEKVFPESFANVISPGSQKEIEVAKSSVLVRITSLDAKEEEEELIPERVSKKSLVEVPTERKETESKQLLEKPIQKLDEKDITTPRTSELSKVHEIVEDEEKTPEIKPAEVKTQVSEDKASAIKEMEVAKSSVLVRVTSLDAGEEEQLIPEKVSKKSLVKVPTERKETESKQLLEKPRQKLDEKDIITPSTSEMTKVHEIVEDEEKPPEMKPAEVKTQVSEDKTSVITPRMPPSNVEVGKSIPNAQKVPDMDFAELSPISDRAIITPPEKEYATSDENDTVEEKRVDVRKQDDTQLEKRPLPRSPRGIDSAVNKEDILPKVPVGRTGTEALTPKLTPKSPAQQKEPAGTVSHIQTVSGKDTPNVMEERLQRPSQIKGPKKIEESAQVTDQRKGHTPLESEIIPKHAKVLHEGAPEEIEDKQKVTGSKELTLRKPLPEPEGLVKDDIVLDKDLPKQIEDRQQAPEPLKGIRATESTKQTSHVDSKVTPKDAKDLDENEESQQATDQRKDTKPTESKMQKPVVETKAMPVTDRATPKRAKLLETPPRKEQDEKQDTPSLRKVPKSIEPTMQETQVETKSTTKDGRALEKVPRKDLPKQIEDRQQVPEPLKGITATESTKQTPHVDSKVPPKDDKDFDEDDSEESQQVPEQRKDTKPTESKMQKPVVERKAMPVTDRATPRDAKLLEKSPRKEQDDRQNVPSVRKVPKSIEPTMQKTPIETKSTPKDGRALEKVPRKDIAGKGPVPKVVPTAKIPRKIDQPKEGSIPVEVSKARGPTTGDRRKTDEMPSKQLTTRKDAAFKESHKQLEKEKEGAVPKRGSSPAIARKSRQQPVSEKESTSISPVRVKEAPKQRLPQKDYQERGEVPERKKRSRDLEPQIPIDEFGHTEIARLRKIPTIPEQPMEIEGIQRKAFKDDGGKELDDCWSQLAALQKRFDAAMQERQGARDYVDDCEDLRRQLDEEKAHSRKLEAALMDMDSRSLISELLAKLKRCEERSRGIEDKIKRQSIDTLQSVRQSYARDMNMLQEKYTTGIERMQVSYEETLDRKNRLHESEIATLHREMAEKMAEIEKLQCFCNAKKRAAPTLCKVLVVVVDIVERECIGDDMLFEYLLRKILYCGLETLCYDDLQTLHSKVYNAAEDIMKKNCHRGWHCKVESCLCPYKLRQKSAQAQVAKLQTEVAVERQRLDKLKKALEIERTRTAENRLKY